MNILIINGVNLNLTGKREQGVYGVKTLEQINDEIKEYCKRNGDSVSFYQSHIEGELVNKLHEAYLLGGVDGIILNAGAYTHYSYALRDAIAAINIPVVETHLSNIHARESFRKNSVLAEVCLGVVCGFGAGSYLAAIEGLRAALNN